MKTAVLINEEVSADLAELASIATTKFLGTEVCAEVKAESKAMWAEITRGYVEEMGFDPDFIPWVVMAAETGEQVIKLFNNYPLRLLNAQQDENITEICRLIYELKHS